jgi:hypothetical protein
MYCASSLKQHSESRPVAPLYDLNILKSDKNLTKHLRRNVNCIHFFHGGVMVNVIASNAIYHGFDHRRVKQKTVQMVFSAFALCAQLKCCQNIRKNTLFDEERVSNCC